MDRWPSIFARTAGGRARESRRRVRDVWKTPESAAPKTATASKPATRETALLIPEAAPVDAETRQVLGAAILGVGGDEVVHSVLDAMYAKAPYTVIQRAVHIHPTVSELIPTILGDLQPLAV